MTIARSWAQEYLYFKIHKASKKIYKYHNIIYIKRSLQYLCAIFDTEPKQTSSHNIYKIQLKILCRFYRNTNLGILHFYFSSKKCSSKVYTYLQKVVVLVTLSTKKLGLLFLDFLRF
jgi:hypothetical protein